ncbi:transposase family protein [Streptomyces sp. CAS3]
MRTSRTARSRSSSGYLRGAGTARGSPSGQDHKPGFRDSLKPGSAHRIIATCIGLGLPVLTDLGYLCAGGTFVTPQRRCPRQELTAQQRSLNKAHARIRHPVERGIARLKTWRIFCKARCAPPGSPQQSKPSSPW